ncbi:MAG: ribonuclease HI [Bacteroidetes bacterium QS_8_68_28]|jgi:ribonuclease HI|nr:MAG: ribonuclease HI [Bacteroidetes bacterium QS_8_68_28]
MNDVTIYTDGGCSPNPGPGGWAAVLLFEEKDVAGRRKTKELKDGTPDSTNNRMELTAALRALEALDEPARVELHTDSKYIANAFNQGWLDDWQDNDWKTASKKPVANKDLWQALLAAAEAHEVEWIWVKAHAGNPLNERVDDMVGAARERFE